MKNGFTLLETLVGVLILGFLLVGLAGGARFGAGAAIRQGQLSDRSGDLDAVDRTLRQIVATADPAAPLAGTAGTLSLVADIPNAPGPKLVALGLESGKLEGGHRLVLRWTSKPPGRPLIPLAAQQAELLTGIAGIKLSYYGAATDTDPAAWQREWNRSGLPMLIRLRIAFTDPAAAHWPDIVMAPRRRS